MEENNRLWPAFPKTGPWLYFLRKVPATSFLIRSLNSPEKSCVDIKLPLCLEGIMKCQFLSKGIGFFGRTVSSEDQRGPESEL